MQAQTKSGIVKLFWSREFDRHWVAYTPDTGYVLFPAERNGWTKRRPVARRELTAVREIPVELAFNTGLPVTVEREPPR